MKNSSVPNKKRKRKLIYSLVIIGILLLIGSGVGYTAYLYAKTERVVEQAHEDTGRENEISQLREAAVDPIEDNVSILFLGIDEREQGISGESRSDAMVLATFNKDEESVKLLSIPRDTYVFIPKVGYSTKINHAHSYGGPAAAMETVEAYLKIPVDYYVRMNFNAFVETVDTLGGIQFDVPFEIVEMDSDDKEEAIHLDPGMQLLSGEEALALARTRKYDNDVERGIRQQELLTQVLRKAMTPGTLPKMEELIERVGSNMTTNLTFGEMKSFFSYILSASTLDIEAIQLEGDGGYMEDGGWYYQVDEENRAEVEELLRQHLGFDTAIDSIPPSQGERPSAFTPS